MPLELPPLPYPYDALEPHIDAQTMQLHHDKHHQAYVNNGNAALEKHPEWAKRSVEDILWSIKDVPEDIRTAVRNNLGQHSNHSIFWTIMGPNGGGNPNGRIADALKNTFGGYEQFKEQFSKAAVGQFGSGWAWLVADRAGKLAIKGYPNGDSPFMDELTPIFGIDVWEHAYYLKYQNRRPDYVAAWFNTLNWESINEIFGRIWS
ncbi:MAG TPA: superoxide dismutase [Candidatus Dormibacteraeota bacterium]|nr:superoxide dismutase [Candidatus Dormibacteraeota bacterium]